jgi:hypothetical protein
MQGSRFIENVSFQLDGVGARGLVDVGRNVVYPAGKWAVRPSVKFTTCANKLWKGNLATKKIAHRGIMISDVTISVSLDQFEVEAVNPSIVVRNGRRVINGWRGDDEGLDERSGKVCDRCLLEFH